ncbi:MAG TPA: hypothetical protein VHK88_05315 [Aquihabitans sp.]|nr:hypothetical protein [Aquihabitans sp.]
MARYWHSGAQTAAVKKIVRAAQVSPADVRTTKGVTVCRGAVWPNVVAARMRRAGFHVEVRGDLLTATRPELDHEVECTAAVSAAAERPAARRLATEAGGPTADELASR